MEASLSPLAVLNLLGAAQGLFLSAVLLGVKGGNRFANRVLAALIVAMAVTVSGAVVRTMHYDFVFPHLSRLHDPFPFLAVPLLYLYIKTLTSGKFAFTRRDFLHLVPFALCVGYLVPYYLQSREAKLKSLTAEYYYPSPGPWYYVRSAVLILLATFYLSLAVANILKFMRAESRRDSPMERAVLFQVRFFAAGFLVLFVGGVLRYLLDQTARTNLLVPLGASVFIYAVGYLSFRNPQVLAGMEAAPAPATTTTTAPAPPARKYEKSSLTPERAERYLKRLLQLMETEKPYLDAELTIAKLAERLSIPAPHLSQTINERLQQNFIDFINTYRVEEAKRRLCDPALKHYSVLAIAEDVGFNSKSSFNSVFKKHTRMTPSEFRRSTEGNGQR